MCVKHVGQYPPTLAIIAAAPGNKGPGWCSLAEREERLFTNRSNRPGDDMKDELRTDNDSYAWSSTRRVSWGARNAY